MLALGLSSRHDDTDSPVMIWLQKTKGEKKILTRHTEGTAGAADGMRSLPWVEESLFGSMKLRKAAKEGQSPGPAASCLRLSSRRGIWKARRPRPASPQPETWRCVVGRALPLATLPSRKSNLSPLFLLELFGYTGTEFSETSPRWTPPGLEDSSLPQGNLGTLPSSSPLQHCPFSFRTEGTAWW